jgi:GTP-binding protein Era
MPEEYKSGFIAVMGSPNVGKSTLVNRMVGQKVSIVSDKPQTTRNTIRGVLTKESYQIVFLDTPGLHEPKNKLGAYMVRAANESARDVDAILFVTDAAAGVKKRDQENIKRLLTYKIPLVFAVNKTDAVKKDRVDAAVEAIHALGAEKDIYPVSAANGSNLEELENALAQYLIPGPKYYPDDMYTDQPERLIAAEMIREKALRLLSEEVPHGVGVEIEKIEKREGKDLIYVAAAIYCERKTHKGIIIGSGGSMLKKIGSESRADLEMLFGSRVYLELFVKVKEDWRNSPSVLKILGYE